MAVALVWLEIPTMKECLVNLLEEERSIGDTWLTSLRDVRPGKRLLFFARRREGDTVQARQELARW